MISIDKLPDEVLLEIFDLCVDKDRGLNFSKKEIEAWQPLVHVCRQWRRVVFVSPRRLNLRLVFTAFTPARDTLDVWPTLPLVINVSVFETEREDDVALVPERSDRVEIIRLFLLIDWGLSLEAALVAMQRPFPELTYLVFEICRGRMEVLSDSFLGGSVPHLQELYFIGIPFPGLPKLLLSASHLATLSLRDIPDSGYILPEVMAASLSTLINLRSLCLRFISFGFDWESFWETRCPPPPTRSILPVLTSFEFEGPGEYLNDIVAGIDAPRLNDLNMSFFMQVIDMLPQLIQFISGIPMFMALEKGHVDFKDYAASIEFSSQTFGHGELIVEVSCKESEWPGQVTPLEQVCALCLPPISTLEDLHIHGVPNSNDLGELFPEDDPWPDLLTLFPSVKNLYLYGEAAPSITPFLEDSFDEGRTALLPALRRIFK